MTFFNQLFVILVAAASLPAATCQDNSEQIFFPREVSASAPSCVAYDGRRGFCRLLAQCATFFAEIAALSRSPCAITDQQQGVCCPPTNSPTKDPGTEVKKRPATQAVVFPEVTVVDINKASEQGLDRFRQREQFAQDLVNRNIVAVPGSPVFWHSRLFETNDDIIKKGKDATIVLETSKDLLNTFNLDEEQVKNGLPKFNVLDTIIKSTCPPPPSCPDPKYSYRTIDGSCNNIKFRDWGKAGVAFTRMLQPQYQDGLSVPRLSVTNQPLPSARAASALLVPPSKETYNNLTNLVWQFGQFLDHDVTHTPITKGANKADISCCSNGQVRQPTDLHPECMPIDISPSDPFYGRFNHRCMEFVRSLAAIRPQCSFGTREQMNQITSYVDASNVYGSSTSEASDLRSFQGGRLKMNSNTGKDLLPGNERNVGCVSKSAAELCFLAGDTRVNEQPDLAVMHTVWARQHNKVVGELSRLNPSWSDEVLYQEGKRIVSAQMQHITYNEFLPIVLGREFMETFGLLPQKNGYFRGYREDVDATVTNGFAAAAFRFGHTLITDHIQGFSKFGNMMQDTAISKLQFLPFALYQPDIMDSLIRGLALQHSQKFDRFVSDELTNKLFAQNRDFGMDLVALNIQRGRDHGIPPYTKFREVCDLPPINTWEDLLRDMDPQVVQMFRQVYADVNDIDLFVGGISERPTGGSLLGPTFLCIVGRQFIRLKIGDRFYYENGASRAINLPGDSGEFLSSFTPEQLDEIRKSSLARILCDNSDNIEMMQPLAFVTAHLANKRAVCNSDILIPRMSLEPWTNTRVWI